MSEFKKVLPLLLVAVLPLALAALTTVA